MNTSDLEGVKTKVCSKCKTEKPVNEFYKDTTKKDGLAHSCKVCRLEECKAHYKANSDKLKKRGKEYHKANPDKIKEQQKKYRAANSDRLKKRVKEYHKANPDKLKERWREYRKANQDKRNAISAKRNAKKLQATPPWLTSEHLSAIRDFYTESKALEKETGIKYHVDHIIPLQGKNVCGLHVPWNLNVLTATENIAKNNSYPNEWEDT